MKLLTHVIYLALIAALSVYAWSRSPSPEPGEAHTIVQMQPHGAGEVDTAESGTEQPPAAHNFNQNNNDMILALMEINEQLQQQLEEAQQKLENEDRDRNRPRNTPSVLGPLHERLGLDPRRLHTEPNYLNEFIESRPQDYERDSHLELLLSDTFVTDEALRDLQTRNLRCRSSVCVVEIDVSHLVDFDDSPLHSNIRSERFLAEGGFDTITIVDNDTVRMIIGFQENST